MIRESGGFTPGLEICPDCNGAGGDNNTFVCHRCDGSGGISPQGLTPELVERLRLYVGVPGPSASEKLCVEAADCIAELTEALKTARIELTARGCLNNSVMDEINAALNEIGGNGSIASSLEDIAQKITRGEW